MVNMTTLTDDCADDVCILGPGDYSLLDHETTIAYSRHRAGRVAGLELLVRNGDFSIVTPVSPETLEKILDGARKSPQIPETKKHLLG